MIAQFFQLEQPYQLFYAFLIGGGFFWLRKGQIKRDLDIENIKADIASLKATVDGLEKSIDQHNNRADMQKNIINEQETRHTNYRKDLSDINSRIDGIFQYIRTGINNND